MNLSLEDAVRERTEELRATVTELRQDLADAEGEVDRLTEQNKLMREALEKIRTGMFQKATRMQTKAQGALTATGEPK